MAITTKALKEKASTIVKNVNGCTNFGGVAMNGKKMYTIKTKSDNKHSTISVYDNYKSTTRKNHLFTNCMGHGNDLTYYNGKLYVAPCAKYVEMVDVKKWSHTRLDTSGITCCSIAHYKDNQFFLSGGGNPKFTITLAELKGTKFVVIKRWTVTNPKAGAGYTTFQGMGYNKDTNKTYNIISHSNLKSNVILRTPIGASEPDLIRTSKTGTGKYEFESLDFGPDGKYVIAANRPSNKDCILLA